MVAYIVSCSLVQPQNVEQAYGAVDKTLFQTLYSQYFQHACLYKAFRLFLEHEYSQVYIRCNRRLHLHL